MRTMERKKGSRKSYSVVTIFIMIPYVKLLSVSLVSINDNQLFSDERTCKKLVILETPQ